MYDHVHGEVTEVQPARVVVRAAGIGYELKVPMGTTARVSVGKVATLFTVLHVVEGNPTLLGFATRGERELCRRLLSVSGVGPALSLAILSTWPPAELVVAIQTGNTALLRKVKGVGAKTAERLCLELRDHLADLDLGDARAAVPPTSPVAEDAVAALVVLGFQEREAREKVRRILHDRPGADTEDLVKTALRG
ncbi:MAG: Holliday junction branch migration protein RuvA [Planctomycetes bacterium]|nr:Holliday junction branch migration protein RuvA [Planctomycetota bacterium]